MFLTQKKYWKKKKKGSNKGLTTQHFPHAKRGLTTQLIYYRLAEAVGTKNPIAICMYTYSLEINCDRSKDWTEIRSRDSRNWELIYNVVAAIGDEQGGGGGEQ